MLSPTSDETFGTHIVSVRLPFSDYFNPNLFQKFKPFFRGYIPSYSRHFSVLRVSDIEVILYSRTSKLKKRKQK